MYLSFVKIYFTLKNDHADLLILLGIFKSFSIFAIFVIP